MKFKSQIKKIIKYILFKVSRLILLCNVIWEHAIPYQLKSIPKSKLELKIEEKLVNETFAHFEKHF